MSVEVKNGNLVILQPANSGSSLPQMPNLLWVDTNPLIDVWGFGGVPAMKMPDNYPMYIPYFGLFGTAVAYTGNVIVGAQTLSFENGVLVSVV